MPYQEGNSEPFPERPIESANQDALGRTGFARRIANSLIDPESGKATGVVVAVTGPWGSGKSSVLNLIQEELEGRNDSSIIVVRFNPWLISTRDDLIQQFLVQLALSLKERETALGRARRLLKAIPTYARTVLPIAGDVATAATVGWWASLFSPVAKLTELLFGQPKKLVDSKREVQQELEKSGLSIAVLIDEVDRVADDEITTLANLVRSIADFPGISYCMAYDRERVAESNRYSAIQLRATRALGSICSVRIVRWQRRFKENQNTQSGKNRAACVRAKRRQSSESSQ